MRLFISNWRDPSFNRALEECPPGTMATEDPGAAIWREGWRFLLRGTLLINVNIQRLAAILTPPKAKLARHGVASLTKREFFAPGIANAAD